MFWIGVVIALGGLLGISLWRNWIQSSLPQATDQALDIILSLLIFGGIMVSVVSHLKSEHENENLRTSLQTTQGEITEARQELTEAQQKQAAAEQALREVQAQQRARTLTPQQRQMLIQRLKGGPKGRVRISITAGDAEADRFATQFYKVLARAGWPMEPLAQVTLIGELPIGLQVGPSQDKTERLAGRQATLPPHGELLLQALRDVGLKVSLKRTYHVGPAEIVHLVVGQKPQPR